MKHDDKVISNLRVGKYITAVTNFLSAVVFTIAYWYLDNIVFLLVAIVLFVLAIIIIIYFSNLEQKYKTKLFTRKKEE
jgi:membrane protein YdbS with pleckstrin-like domain